MNALEFFTNVKATAQVKIFNSISEADPIKRFSDRKTGGKRIIAALADFDAIEKPVEEIELADISEGIAGGLNVILTEEGCDLIEIAKPEPEPETALDGAIEIIGSETLSVAAEEDLGQVYEEQEAIKPTETTPKASAPVSDAPKLPKPGTKKRIVFDLALREKGVTKAELAEATGWPRANATLGRVATAAGYKLTRFKRPNGESAWKAEERGA
ncbi:hypothetical protein [Roseibium aggregatum]|uniref:DUF3489 domain-containing protein n=1 Tax=Roseibium aggregatum TaxID=187304 RepID=A0A0M6Y871_9HYPH|nr:hypothetical protein [Roseibium aggregatum]CTQ45733.1 hypothetical protein LAL4801_04188 [Roseibium aggregatum]